jgi:ATP-dependent DNA helicase RecG
VSLPNLGLAVVDEQHRFGVLQRVRLRQRPDGEPLPHLLLMTATPIPRSMALALYGDLDLSVLDEKPPGRLPPETRLYLGRDRERAYELVEQQMEQGARVFVVCPLVEESEKLSAADAVGTAEQLRARFPHRQVGLVHGRLPPHERDGAVRAFRAGETDLLVATTVVEVGIDVPDASVMVIEHAERFGLAQLHQLRGRVGRGGGSAYCLLLSEASPETIAGQRLQVLARSHDGFDIAEADLQLRGPGEVFGTRQAGLPRLRFADLRQHMQILERVREAAIALVDRDPELVDPAHAEARHLMLERWADTALVGEEAG